MIQAVGDVVLLKEEEPRLQWKVGRMHTFTRLRDGAVRSALVRVIDARGCDRLVCRPTKLLILLTTYTNIYDESAFTCILNFVHIAPTFYGSMVLKISS